MLYLRFRLYRREMKLNPREIVNLVKHPPYQLSIHQCRVLASDLGSQSCFDFADTRRTDKYDQPRGGGQVKL
jgi:hypothetical protein